MASRIVAAILARNEAGRYLRDTIDSLHPLVDDILLLDDNSTDETPQLAKALGCQVRTRTGPLMWGQESSARQELWQWGSEVCGDGWLYIADADHVTKADPEAWKALCTSWTVNAWAFPLYDLWDSPDTYRSDGYWQAHHHPRPWLFKPSAVHGTWSERGIHVGHAPVGNWIVGYPEGMAIHHLGWMKAEDRKVKHSRYQETGAMLSPFESFHLATVLEGV